MDIAADGLLLTGGLPHIGSAEGAAEADVTVEVPVRPDDPAAEPPPGLADTGEPLTWLVAVGLALAAAGWGLRHVADRFARGGT